MNYDEFINRHIDKKCDIDNIADVQCVDLVVAYMYDVFNSGIKNFWFDAHHFYNNFYSNKWLIENFTRIANTPEFVPRKGDICVWGGGKYGHIAIATGEGNTTYFYSYDQNWTGNNDPCTKIKHNYNNFLGVLRPKNQNKIFPQNKILDETGFKIGDKSIGVLALKQLLIIAGHKMDNNNIFGEGTKNAINYYLKKWGYDTNGIAGTKFIKKIGKMLK